MQSSTRAELELIVRNAFAGVRLGQGITLRRAGLLDTWDGDAPNFIDRVPDGGETLDDWAAVPPVDLESNHIAHLDAEGLRFYLPALLLRLLSHYGDGSEMWTIGTIRALDQRRRHPRGFLELLTDKQRRAIAVYVRTLPQLVDLAAEDASTISRALRDVWSPYLDEGFNDGLSERT